MSRGFGILILSLWLDFLIPSIFNTNFSGFTFFLPLLTITGIIYSYKHFADNLNIYFITAFILGLSIDLLVTNTFILNALFYLTIAFITAVVASYFKPHYLVNLSLLGFNILFYLITSYLLLSFYDAYLFNWLVFLIGILGSFLLNFIYLSIITYLDNKTTKKRSKYY